MQDARYRKQDTGLRWDQFIEKLFKEAEPYLAIRGDVLHTRVAHEYALELMGHEGGDRGIVEPAIILHDVGWSALEPEQIRSAFGIRAEGVEAKRLNHIHEMEGAFIARQILNTLNYNPLLIDKIVFIIHRHDSGTNTHFLEEKLVRDADKLWRFSRIGFCKEIERQGVDSGEYYQSLAERYQDWLFTSTALNLAEEELKNRAKEINPKTERP